METAAIAAGVMSAAAWVYLLLGRGWFWNLHRCSARNVCGKAQNGNGVSVVAVVPARNERETIGRCVTSLFGQRFGGELRVMVVDDQSEDGTAEAALMAVSSHLVSSKSESVVVQESRHPVAPNPGATSVGQPQLLVIGGKAVPEGWTGKVWAMQQGIEAAGAFSPKYLLLTDADVVHAPDSLATLVTIAASGEYDLVSLMVRLHCESVAERLLIPAFVFFFFMLYPPRWVADRRNATAGAAGGAMLVRREGLERAGGMEAIRGEVIDDCALARRIKNIPALAKPGPEQGTQSSVWLGLSDETESVRAYGGLGGIGRMIARTAFNQLRHSGLMLAGALVGLANAFLFPVALTLLYPTLANPARVGHPAMGHPAMMLGGVAWALMTLAYLPMVRHYRLNPLWAVTLPLAASFYMGATVWSALKYWSGSGGEWKGRAQDVR